jgi:archaeosine synthase
MSYFYEILTKQAGYSRIGRIILSKEAKKYIGTPEIVIPMKRMLMNYLGFLEEFQDHKIFLITKEIYLKIGFLREKFKDTGFLFTHNGTLAKFNEILERNIDNISQNNVLCLIPFNVPNTIISKEFAVNEITNYLQRAKKIVSEHSNILFGLSIRIFDYPDLIELYSLFIKEHSNIKILNLLDLFDNFAKYRKILEAIVNIKSNLDNNTVLMASGKIVPSQFPFLIYLGIDLINASYMVYLSSENFYDTTEYLLPIYKVHDFPCSCFACKSVLKKIKQEKYSGEKLELLCLHNIISAKNFVNKIKQYLKTEDFRNFLEKAVLNDLNLISALKILDRNYYDILKYETPITQQNKIIKCIGVSSYHRPDFREFRERLISTFTPESWTSLILIYPCSSKKPYSESKSHKAFQKVMRKFPEFPDFQEIILTSPLGAIPRQFENIYPVSSYDISVTGFWDTEEIKITANMLLEILQKYNTEIPIICHLKGKGYQRVIKKVSKLLDHDIYFTEVEESLITKDSLNSLYKKIEELKDKYHPKESLSAKDQNHKTWNRKLIKILDYQFGVGTGMMLMNDSIKIKKDNRRNKLEISDSKSKEVIGYFKFDSGQIELTLDGAKRLFPLSKIEKHLVFDGDVIKGSTLFRPGIIEYSAELKPKDIVLILNKKKENVIGLGQLIIGKNFIRNSNSGKVVEIYEKL